MLTLGLLGGLSSSASAQGPNMKPGYNPGPPLPPGVKTTFVDLAGGVPGVLYEPTSPGPRAAIGVFVMHAEGDYLRFSACTELSKRGYTVLCANNSTPKSGGSVNFDAERILLDFSRGVSYLRTLPRIHKVVLFGHSGGGAMMSAYQYVAENGPKNSCQSPEKIFKCSDMLQGIPPADGIMLIDSNWGMAGMMLFSIDPAVLDPHQGQPLNPDLDLFNPKNGYDPKGSNYSPEFIHKFQAAVSRRNNEIVQAALDRLAIIKDGKGDYSDDEPYTVPGASLLGFNNKLFAEDTRLMSHTKAPWPLLHADGSVTTEIVHSVRVPEGRALTPTLGAAMQATVHSYLTSFAIRTTPDYGFDEDSVHGVDWDSSYTVPPGNVKGISAPLLTMGMTGHWEYLAAETIYNNAKSKDKTIAFVEGAQHTYTPCKQCEKTPGQFGDTIKTLYDYIDTWLAKPGRFLTTAAH